MQMTKTQPSYFKLLSSLGERCLREFRKVTPSSALFPLLTSLMLIKILGEELGSSKLTVMKLMKKEIYFYFRKEVEVDPVELLCVDLFRYLTNPPTKSTIKNLALTNLKNSTHTTTATTTEKNTNTSATNTPTKISTSINTPPTHTANTVTPSSTQTTNPSAQNNTEPNNVSSLTKNPDFVFPSISDRNYHGSRVSSSSIWKGSRFDTNRSKRKASSSCCTNSAELRSSYLSDYQSFWTISSSRHQTLCQMLSTDRDNSWTTCICKRATVGSCCSPSSQRPQMGFRWVPSPLARGSSRTSPIDRRGISSQLPSSWLRTTPSRKLIRC